jgi:glycogen(starch) synthase
MKVLLLGPYPPPHGGVQSNLVAIRNFLRQQNIPCSVINITRHRQSDADTDTNDVYYPANALELARLLFRLDYNVVHLHVGGMLTSRLVALALLCTLMPGSKSVMTFHSGGFPSSPEGNAMRRNSFACFVLRRFDALIGVNSEIVNFFLRLGALPQRVRLILPHSFVPQGSDLEPDKPASNLPELLAKFFARHNPVLISVGLLEPEYDLPLQIEALGKVRKNFPSAGLLLIGSGSLEDDLRSRIKQQPWAEHILLTGDVPHSVTMLAIAQSRLMLRTTLYDGDAVSVRESQYLGTPVIASDNGMRPAGVRLIPKSDLSALTTAMAQELSQPKPPQQNLAGDESNLAAVMNLYRELLAGKND